MCHYYYLYLIGINSITFKFLYLNMSVIERFMLDKRRVH